ncbi:MAG: hypothetical protein AB7U46_03975 [Paenirhodobacter sp.]|uniref:hypothetical protein n=1 Tax=Paenirhodobacter sp. TaxID=1965326 RepID=UPI003D0DC0A9
MRLHLLLILVLIGLAAPATAQQISVKSGEHADFSRLVFMFPRGTAWNLEPVDGGLRLTTPGKSFRYDVSQVFRLIPRDRVNAITPDFADSAVMIATPPNVRPQTFQLQNGALVLDLRDGTGETAAMATAPPAAYRPPRQEDHLDLYWRGIAPPSGMDSEPQVPTEQPDILLFAPKARDPRVEQAETELLAQLGRAASQGLITMQIPPKAAEQSAAETFAEDAALPTEKNGLAPHIALHSETVVDRDTAAQWPGTELSNSGTVCLPDADFDLKAWLDETPAGEQISAARRDLVGEFDRPRRDAIRRLGRIYVALGFGAESRALYHSFGISPDTDPGTMLIADLLDEKPVSSQNPILTMTNCDGKVALWSLLAHTAPPARTDVNFGAVMRGFGALPIHMRERFGPDLIERLIGMGATDLARTARASLSRAPGDHGEALDMMNADIDLSEGKTRDAEHRLEKVSQTDTVHAPEALIKYAETRLSGGLPLDQGTIDNIGAIAHELDGTETGWRLIRTQILGLASIGSYPAAFAQLDKWPGETEPELRQKTLRDLYDLLAKVPDDTLFLTSYFARLTEAQASQLPDTLQLTLADRLSKLGFAKPANDILSAQVKATTAGKLSLARAALADNDAAAALVYLDGIDSQEAAHLRGQALGMLGEHFDAMGAFEHSGDQNAALAEAWRSGDWTTVASKGTESQRKLLELYELDAATAAPLPSGTSEEDGLLRRSTDLLAQSAAERNALEQLLKDYSLD